MARQANDNRMCIYIGPELRGRIDAAEGKYNWSAIACRAFEAALAKGPDSITIPAYMEEMVDAIAKRVQEKIGA